MDLLTAVRDRRSIRAFTPELVSEQTVIEVLELAQWAPSWGNTQPWAVFVVTGERLEKLKAAYRERWAANAGRFFEIAPPRPDWPAKLAERMRLIMVGRALSNEVGSPAPSNADFYGAPCLLLFAIDEQLQPEYACFDTGLLVQTVCLVAHAKGLGTCIMAMAVGYPDVLHDLVPAAAGRQFVVGVALGVPDVKSPINRLDRQRASLTELASFVS